MKLLQAMDFKKNDRHDATPPERGQGIYTMYSFLPLPRLASSLALMNANVI